MGERERKGGRRGARGSPVYPRWVWVLCSFPGSMQSFSLSLSGAVARVHTAGMTSKAALSALGPVGSIADNELFTIAPTEKPQNSREGERGEEVHGSHQC